MFSWRRMNRVKKIPEFSCSQRTLPDIELITLEWAQCNHKSPSTWKGAQKSQCQGHVI